MASSSNYRDCRRIFSFMRDREFQEKLLGIERPWFVDAVAVDREGKTVETFVGGCAMDANANWGCGGGLFGNASATPLPNGPTPVPTTYPSPYGGPVVIAQATSAPTAQPGNVLVAGTSAAVTHNACSASSGIPCEFTWSISSFSSGVGTTTVTVPASSVCVVTATQSPVVASGDVMTTWVTIGPFTPLTVHAQDLLGTYSGSYGGNGNCD